MDASAVAGLFTLLVVNYDSSVHVTTFQTLKQCRDAESMVLYGKTVEEKKEDDRKQKERDDAELIKLLRDKIEWMKKHPPREPKTDDEKAIAAGIKSSFSAKVERCSDDKVCDVDPKTWLANGTSIYTGAHSPSDVKFTRCVVDP